MRRIPLSLAVATALVPVLGTLTAAPAQAAGSSSLTVTTIGRNGAKLTSDLNLLNTSTGKYVKAKSGKKVTLAKGLYSVTVDIQTPNTSIYLMSDTIAAVRVSVSGSTKLTLDARKGKPVRASVDATSGSAAGAYSTLETAAVCPGDDVSGLFGVYNVPGQVFEIPNAKSTYFHFSWMESWVSDDQGPGTGNGTAYYVTKATTGLPTTPTATFHRSSMAKIALSMRGGETTQPMDTISVSPSDRSTVCEDILYGDSYNGSAPYNATAYVTPGHWSLNSSGGDSNSYVDDRTFKAGGSYGQTFERAVWGPAQGLPFVGRKDIDYRPYNTIGDASGGTNGLADTVDKVTLSKAGKVLKTKTVKGGSTGATTFSAPITKAGWYVLKVTATRTHAAALSDRVDLDWHFHADPAHSQVVPGYLAALSPTGLNRHNSAALRSTTPVTVSLLRSSAEWDEPFAKETVKSLKVYASHDNGKTWHAVSVHKVGGHWVAEVPEPATAGSVALRTVATDTVGSSSTQTVYHAFNVG